MDKFIDLEFGSSNATDEDSVSKEKQDYVQSYASEVLSLGLSLMEYCNSIHEGDGPRILKVWRYLFFAV